MIQHNGDIALASIGAGILAVGVGAIYWPAGVIVVGLYFIALALVI